MIVADEWIDNQIEALQMCLSIWPAVGYTGYIEKSYTFKEIVTFEIICLIIIKFIQLSG